MSNMKKYPITEEESSRYVYNYWNTQPIIKNKKNMIVSRIINKNLEKEVFELPKSLNIEVVSETNSDITTYLSKTGLVLNDSNYKTNIFILLRLKLTNEIVGLLYSTVENITVGTKTPKMVVVKNVSLDDRLHGKNVSLFLFKQLKNYCLDNNIVGGIYMTGHYVPTPVSEIKYYYRPLQYERLYNLNYITCDKDIYNKVLARYTVNKSVSSRTVKMVESQYEKCYELYNKYMERYNIHNNFTLDEFVNIFKNTDKTITYVILSDTGTVCDFFSYEKSNVTYEGENIVTASLLMYTSLDNEYAVRKIMKHVIITAYHNGCDILKVSNMLENYELTDEPDSDFIHSNSFYLNLYNWEAPLMKPFQIALI